jgi:hypothetical protein
MPVILIVEPHREVATALQEVIASAHHQTVVIPHLERLADLGMTPAAIVIRVAFEGREPAHTALTRLPADRPPIVAIAWAEDEAAEAARLRCDVVLRGARDVSRLCDVLTRIVHA